MDHGALKAVVRNLFLNLVEIPLGLKNEMPLERILNNPIKYLTGWITQ